MEVFDFSLEYYNYYGGEKIKSRRRALFRVLGLILLAIVVSVYFMIKSSNIDLIIFIYFFVFFLFYAASNITGEAFLSIDYFELKNTFYVMYQSQLYLVTIIPRDSLGNYEEINDFRMFCFLLLGFDMFHSNLLASTRKFGPSKDDLLRNFPHFIVNNDFETLKVQCLGYIHECNDTGDTLFVRTSNRIENIKKYYNNINNIQNYIVRDSFYRGV